MMQVVGRRKFGEISRLLSYLICSSYVVYLLKLNCSLGAEPVPSCDHDVTAGLHSFYHQKLPVIMQSQHYQYKFCFGVPALC